jgi:hypothetical protein
LGYLFMTTCTQLDFVHLRGIAERVCEAFLECTRYFHHVSVGP